MVDLKSKLLIALWGLIIALIFTALITKHHVAILLLAVCCFTVGLYLFSRFVQLLYVGFGAKRWKQVPFQVVNSGIEVEPRPGMHVGNNFFTWFEVEYAFEGGSYIKRNADLDIFNQSTYFTIHKAQDYIDRVNNGLYGSYIYINPNNPNVAIIKPGIRLMHLKVLLFSLLFCIPSALGGMLVLMLNNYF